ncbi:MAG: hypothetical protein V1702_01060 [Candidatus Woesearchaeota archaeon]
MTQSLETVVGTLLQCHEQLKEGTWLTSAELTDERRTHPDEEVRRNLREAEFWTGNFGMYAVEGGEPILYFGRRSENPILNNIEKARELWNEQTGRAYTPSRMEIEAVMGSAKAGLTEIFPFSELKLEKEKGDSCFVRVSTTGYAFLNETQRRLAEIVYGAGDHFRENMKMLAASGIGNTKIYVLSPDFVRQHAKDNAIVLPVLLYNFSSNSSCDIGDLVLVDAIGSNRYAMHGVPRVPLLSGDATGFLNHLKQKT